MIPAWLYASIEKALTLDTVLPCVFILNNKSTEDPLEIKENNSSFHGLNKYLYDFYSKWDENRYRKRYINDENDAFSFKDIRLLLPFTPTIEIDFEKTEGFDAIKELKLDVIFYLGKTAIDGNLLNLSTHGIWCFRHGDPQKNRSGPPGFWEIFYNEGAIFSILQHLTQCTGEGEVLAQAIIPTNEQNSMFMTRNALAWDSTPLFYLCLKKLIDTGSPILNLNCKAQVTHFSLKIPSLSKIMILFTKLLHRKMKNPAGFISQHWCIQISPNIQELKNLKLKKEGFRILNQPPGKFWADPFLISVENKEYLFFEEFNYSTHKGIIKVGEINENGFVDKPITILEDAFHFSNPSVFIEEGALYLLPEQAESGEIALYKCVNFPDKWEKVHTLMKQGYFVDPILLKKDGKWWLFCVEKLVKFGQPTIYGRLFFSNDLFGEWQEHPMSPISTDCRYSRSAGLIMQKDNQLIRAVQDCSHGYGYKINFLKIRTLSETIYEDEPFDLLGPAQFNVEGIHTVNFSKQLVAIDTRKRIAKKNLNIDFNKT